MTDDLLPGEGATWQDVLEGRAAWWLVCGARLDLDPRAECCAVRCSPCQAAGLCGPLAAATPATLPPTLAALIVASPRRHGLAWRATTHADGLALCGLAGDANQEG